MAKIPPPGEDKSNGNGQDPGNLAGDEHTAEEIIENSKEPPTTGAFGEGKQN